MHVPPPEGPPPGGYGSGPPARGAGGVTRFGPGPPAPGASGSGGRAVIVTLVTVGVIVAMLGTLGVLGVIGVRKYVSGAKPSEVKNTLGQVAKDAATRFELDHRMCPSASRPVPTETSSIRGRKYQSAHAEWEVDRPRDAGFACLEFSMSQPQYYQYRYEATATSFLAGGRGDLNGDGRLSDFIVRGEVRDGRLMVSPSIEESDPEE